MTLDLFVGLANHAGRADAVARLAAHLHVDEALLFVTDPAVGVLVPAAGMAQTIRGGPAWRGFLRQCAAPGRHCGQVDLPPPALRSATACSSGGMALILLGGGVDAADVETLERLLPLLDALLSTELRAGLAAAEAGAARQAAQRANTLAEALEHARAESSRLNAELREEERHKNEFLAMLAHELRNPLAPVVTSIAALRRMPTLSEPAQKLLSIMGRQSAQLSRLIEDLMDMARVSQGRIELRPQAVDLRQVVNHAVEGARDLIERRHHQLSVDIPDTELVVHGDPTRLTQIVSNLLNNAAKYTDDGGRISVTAHQEGDNAVIEVADNGIGIEAPMLARVFDLFSQAPVSIQRSQGGLGIGLTLVRSLLQKHGGAITAYSAGRGQGSRFTATVPLIATSTPLLQSGTV